MQCPSCGTAIPSYSTTCPRCRASILAGDISNLSYDEHEATPYIDYSSAAAPSGPAQSPAAAPLAASEIPVPSTAVAASSTARPPAPRKAMLSSTLLMLVILAGLLIAGGGGAAAYAALLYPSELHVQATAVAQHILSTEANATATALAASPQNLYNRVTQTKPSFSDALNNPASSLWPTRTQGGNGCVLANGAFHVLMTPGTSYQYCPDLYSTFHNAIFQAQATIIHGYDAGISIRAGLQGQVLTGYTFSISATGLYTLYVISSAQSGSYLAFGRSSAIKTGLNQANLLAIMASGATISVFINGQFITSVQDTTFAAGNIGFAATNFTNTHADIAYTNAQQWNIP